MKTIKKLITSIIVLATMVSFVACGSKKSEEKYTKGVLTDNSYESEFINVKFELPDNFTLNTEDELDQYMEQVCQVMYAENSDQALDYINMTTVYEMMVQGPNGLPNAVVMAEKASEQLKTEDKYIATLTEQLKMMGYQISDTQDTDFLGAKYKKIDTTLEANGQKVSQQYYIRKIGDRFVSFCFTYLEGQESDRDTLISSFKVLK